MQHEKDFWKILKINPNLAKIYKKAILTTLIKLIIPAGGQDKEAGKT